jgi:hypothetical protein
MTHLDDMRRMKDQYFATSPDSPLTPEQQQGFHGLNYFPENPTLRLEVVVDVFVTKENIVIQTTTGDEREYKRHGRFKFTADGQPAELTLYYGEHGFFLPFVDALAGIETYPAGRYLEPEPLLGDRFLVDFNDAYNPFCAYNEQWSCPITPAENKLKVPIRAGEKILHA